MRKRYRNTQERQPRETIPHIAKEGVMLLIAIQSVGFVLMGTFFFFLYLYKIINGIPLYLNGEIAHHAYEKAICVGGTILFICMGAAYSIFYYRRMKRPTCVEAEEAHRDGPEK